MPSNRGGYQPYTRDNSSRRADFDLQRRITAIEQALAEGGGGGPVTPGAGYVHNQGTPAASWTVVHGLGFRPNVTVEDSSGTTVEGEIVHDSATQLTLIFSAAFSGIAYCS